MLPPSNSDAIANIPITLSPPTSPGLRAPSDDQLFTPDDMRLSRPSSQLDSLSSPVSREPSPLRRGASLFVKNKKAVDDGLVATSAAAPPSRRKSLRRTFSAQMSKAGILFRNSQNSQAIVESPPLSPPQSNRHPRSPSSSPTPRIEKADARSGDSGDVGGPRFYGSGMYESDNLRRAGELEVYQNGLVSTLVCITLQQG
jgi:hypothetical protein